MDHHQHHHMNAPESEGMEHHHNHDQHQMHAALPETNVNDLLNSSQHDHMHYGLSQDHSGASHGGGHSMAMTFHGGVMETILFSWWNTNDMGAFVGSFLAIYVIALLYEGLKYYRKHLLWKTYVGLQYCAVSPPDKNTPSGCAPDEPQVIQPKMLSKPHAWQTVLHGLQVFVSYMLMLVFMTFNTWLCLAVVLGSATGYFLFGWRESVVVDFTEHCH